MRPLPHTLPLTLLPFVLPAALANELATPTPPDTAANNAQHAADAQGAAAWVDTTLQELGAEPQPVLPAEGADTSMPEAPEGQSVAVCDGGLFFDAANSRLVYLGNVRLNDERVQLRAAHRLYLQLPREKTEESAEGVRDEALHPSEATPAAADAAPVATKPQEDEAEDGSATPPAAPAIPLEVTAYDAMVDTVGNRMLFSTGPGVPQLIFRQGNNTLVLEQAEGSPARALADEAGNLLLEAVAIRLHWQEEDGSVSELYTGGGKALYHAASHAIVMEGPVEATYRNGESTLRCTGALCVTLQPEEGEQRPASGFMGQFSSMRFSAVAAATATGNVHLASRTSGEQMEVSGDALHYNGLTGAVEIPGSPCILSYGKDGRNVLQTQGSLVLEPNGDIHLRGTGTIEGVYERPARAEGAPPLRGTLSAMAPLSFHADSGTITTRALNCQDAEASISCSGEVQLTLTPLTAEELDRADLPTREKAGMINLAIARFGDVSEVKARGNVRAEFLDPATPGTPEATLAASALKANLTTGEVHLTGEGEPAAIAFRSYSLTSTADELEPALIHLHQNGDIEARGTRVTTTLPSDKGSTTLTCAERIHLARGPRSLSLGPRSRLQSPDGILTTNGPLQAVLAASTTPAKPISSRYPQLSYNFSGLESAETFEGATIRTAQGSMQCSQRLSVLMLPPGSPAAAQNDLGGIRSAIAIGRVSLAARDSGGRMLRAMGDRLDINGTTGEKRLTGSRVVLEDARNRHEATGAGAAVRIDARNNARITGERHTTSATGIREQVEEQKTQKDESKKQN